jgi:hypothetical protein
MPFTSKDIFIPPVYNPNTGDASAERESSILTDNE